MAHAAATWLGLLPVLCSASVKFEARFQCRYSSAKNWEECLSSTVRGHCHNNEECLTRFNAKTRQMYAACCCSNTTTPVHQITHELLPNGSDKWSVWIIHEDPRGQPGLGHCGVLACARPWTAQKCFENEPLCCPENTKCGMFLSNGSSCYGRSEPPTVPSSSTSEDCCTTDIGGICAWMHGRSPSLPGRKPCCLQFEENCYKGCGLTWGLLGVSLGLVPTAGFALHKCTKPVGLIFVLLGSAITQAELAHLANHAVQEVATWVIYVSLVLLVWRFGLFLRAFRRRRAARARCHGGRVRLAVLLLIAEYESTLWPDVPDNSMSNLKRTLESLGWETMLFCNPPHKHFEFIANTILQKISGTSNSQVVIYVSCHAMMVFAMPCIFPCDVGGGLSCWFRTVSLYGFLHSLNTSEAVNTHFVVFVNGCLSAATCWHQLWWRLCYCRNQEVRLSDSRTVGREEAHFNIFFACDLGREAYGDHLTKAVDQILQVKDKTLVEIFESIRVKLQEECLQRPWLMTSDGTTGIVLNPSDREVALAPASCILTSDAPCCEGDSHSLADSFLSAPSDMR